jgi:hypothetical protein
MYTVGRLIEGIAMTNDELDRINRELERVGAKDVCLACGSPDTLIDPRSRTALLAMDDREVQFERAIEAVAVICEHCGFIRLHSNLQLFKDND